MNHDSPTRMEMFVWSCIFISIFVGLYFAGVIVRSIFL